MAQVSIDSDKMRKWMVDNKKVPSAQLAQIESAIGVVMMSTMMSGGDLSEASIKSVVASFKGDPKVTEDDMRRFTRAGQLICEYVKCLESKPWWKFWG